MTPTIQTAQPGKWLDLSTTGHPVTWYQTVKTEYVGVILDCMSQGWTADYWNALTAGLQVMLFQGYEPGMWADSAQAGIRAQLAAQQAKIVNYQGTLLLDCEDMPVNAQAALDWINQWNDILHGAGYTSLGVYEGAGCPLNGAEWYDGLALTTHYWKSASTVPFVAVRGYQIVQTAVDQMFAGVIVDDDTVQADALHDLPNAAVAPRNAVSPVDWQPQISALQKQIADLQAQHAQLTTQVTALQTRLTNAGTALGGS